jgi:hypothetical protein
MALYLSLAANRAPILGRRAGKDCQYESEDVLATSHVGDYALGPGRGATDGLHGRTGPITKTQPCQTSLCLSIARGSGSPNTGFCIV